MKTSTIFKNNKLMFATATVFWIVLWQIASMIVGEDLLLVSPYTVLGTLARLMGEGTFWYSLASSFVRITGGFSLGLALGIMLAALSAKLRFVEILLSPFMITISTVPVASFIVLALMWLGNAANLSILISFMMVLPIIYTGVLQGIKSTDTRLLQLGEVYRLPCARRVLYIYAPEIMPHFMSACKVSLGLCWKSAVAAEVIGISSHSIGGAIYSAKLLFATDEVFAWTIAMVAISICFEKAVLAIIRRAQNRCMV